MVTTRVVAEPPWRGRTCGHVVGHGRVHPRGARQHRVVEAGRRLFHVSTPGVGTDSFERLFEVVENGVRKADGGRDVAPAGSLFRTSGDVDEVSLERDRRVLAPDAAWAAQPAIRCGGEPTFPKARPCEKAWKSSWPGVVSTSVRSWRR
jgi:hypothetical protein